jgi:hypothetical protein
VPDRDAEASGLPVHPGKEFLSGNAIRKARMIMRAGNHRRAALAAVDHGYAQPEPGQIDGRGQSGWASTDDQAIRNIAQRARMLDLGFNV